MDLGLNGAKVFVAASRSGLGAATARQFSLEGAHVAINGRSAESLQITVDEIHAETGNPVYGIPADLTNGVLVRGAIEQAAEKLGGLDILVTNAGGPPPGKFEDFSLDQWQGAFDSLLMSVVLMVETALPYLRDSQIASILTITSLTVKQPADNLLLSNVMRSGIAGLVKSLANQYGAEGMRVNAILPGWTATDRVGEILEKSASKLNRSIDDLKADRIKNIPLGRIGSPQEFANVAVFISSPAAGFVSGAMIPVDGGQIKATM